MAIVNKNHFFVSLLFVFGICANEIAIDEMKAKVKANLKKTWEDCAAKNDDLACHAIWDLFIEMTKESARQNRDDFEEKKSMWIDAQKLFQAMKI